jgi:putative endopeptidase
VADEATNIGALGALVAHELTHALDATGRMHDYRGNLADWWTAEDSSEFERRMAELVQQGCEYAVLGIRINGQLTLSENIADLGGLCIAFDALLQSLNERDEPAPLVDGFSPQQRFFLSWAHIWRENISHKRALQRLATDPHAPKEFRVNGPLRNMREFHEAFGAKRGDPMWRSAEDCIIIW